MTIEPESAPKPPTRRAWMIEEFQNARRRRQERMRGPTIAAPVETVPPETPAPRVPDDSSEALAVLP